MDTQSQIQKMQTYLCQQILQKGFEKQEFASYLINQKQNGNDINNWKFQQLKQKVTQFKNSKFSVFQENLNFPQNKSNIIKQANSQVLVSAVKSFFIKPQDVYYEKSILTDKSISKCIQVVEFKPFQSRIKYDQISIKIQKPTIISIGGILGIGKTNQLWFTIRSLLIENQNQYCVQRKDTDFQWLYNCLVRFYPGYAISPLQKSLKNPYDEQSVLQGRRRQIQTFLKTIARRPILLNNKLLIGFLVQKDKEKFQRFKNDMNSTDSLKIIKNFQSESGYIDLQLSNQIQKKNKGIINYINQGEIKLSKIIQALQNLSKGYDILIENYCEIYNNVGDLFQNYTDLVKSFQNLKNSKMLQLLTKLKKSIDDTINFQKIKKKMAQQNLNMIVKYNKKQHNAIKQLFKQKSILQQQYLVFKDILLKRKQKMYPNYSSWDIPASIVSKITDLDKLPKDEVMEYFLPKQTRIQRQKRQWLSYFNKKCEEQFMKMIQLSYQRYDQTFKIICRKFKQPMNRQLAQLKTYLSIQEIK